MFDYSGFLCSVAVPLDEQSTMRGKVYGNIIMYVLTFVYVFSNYEIIYECTHGGKLRSDAASLDGAKEILRLSLSFFHFHF